MEELYSLYIEIYGKVKSGKVIEEGDYRKEPRGGVRGNKRPLKEKLAISLAIDHAKSSGILTKEDFEEEIQKLLGNSEKNE